MCVLCIYLCMYLFLYIYIYTHVVCVRVCIYISFGIIDIYLCIFLSGGGIYDLQLFCSYSCQVNVSLAEKVNSIFSKWVVFSREGKLKGEDGQAEEWGLRAF